LRNLAGDSRVFQIPHRRDDARSRLNKPVSRSFALPAHFVPLFQKLRHVGQCNKRGNAIEPHLRAMPIVPRRKSGKTDKTNAGRAARANERAVLGFTYVM